MSLEVRIPKEITEYREKIIFGLSARQLASTGVALGTGVGLYFFLKNIIGSNLTTYVVMILVAPIFAFGFYRKNGMSFEKFTKLYIRHLFCVHKKKYATELNVDLLKKEDENNNDIKRGKITRNIEKNNRTTALYVIKEGAENKEQNLEYSAKERFEGSKNPREGTDCKKKTIGEGKLDFGAKSSKEYLQKSYENIASRIEQKREVQRAEFTKKELKDNTKYLIKKIKSARKELKSARDSQKRIAKFQGIQDCSEVHTL